MSNQRTSNSGLGGGLRRTIVSPQSTGFGSNQVLYFPNDTVKFKQIERVGTIYDRTRVYFGELTAVRREPNRVIFEFQDGRVRFDAWSVTHMENNMALLNVGCCYTLTGYMCVQCVSEKYDRATNASFRYRVLLGDVRVVQEERVQASENQNSPTLFSDLRRTLQGQNGFTMQLKNVTIVTGDVHGYMGCETCTTSISTRDADGNYYCRQCRRRDGPRQRRVCFVYRNVVLRDQHGEEIDGLICYENELRALVGERRFNELRNYPFDMLEFEEYLGGNIDAILKRARPRDSDQYPPSMVLRSITLLPDRG